MTANRVICGAVMCGAVVVGAGPVALVEDGRSAHVIYVDREAPGSVREAAADLQRLLALATGAELEIVSEVRRPLICLGANAVSAQAGIRADALAIEGYRIVVRDPDVYIVGVDTPAGGQAPGGGVSRGTSNGIYTFLERHLGVRWLMPGEAGEFVPRSASLVLAESDVAEAPVMLNRRLPYTHERKPLVQTWWARQKLGYSLSLSHGHNWKAIKAAEFREHPDWFAERGGVRVPPSGHYKLCQTNPELIAAFAERALAHFAAHPTSTCFSLSPSDGGGWCECSRCSSYYEPDPLGGVSVTPAVLHFYNEVAKRVGVHYPDRLLAGYVYAGYVFPPRQPYRLAPNLFLVWAPSFDYGFTLYRPQVRALWEELAEQWTRATENIAYYDLPNCVSNTVGAPNPPALEILDFLYPRLKRSNMKGVYVYGNSAWGHSACMNYLLAKLAWDPDADVEALFNEFCDTAYGRGGSAIKAFYRLLDAETKRFFIDNESASYTLSDAWLKEVYAANFPRLEQLYREAQESIEDEQAMARLEMLGVNLRILHWTLRQRSMLADVPSMFHMTDADYLALLDQHEGSIALREPAARRSRTTPPERLRLTVPAGKIPNATPPRAYWLRGNQEMVLQPLADGPVRLNFVPRRVYGSLIWAHLYGSDGRRIRRFILSENAPVEFAGRAGELYVLQIDGGRAFYRLDVTGARWALNANVSDQGLHLIQEASPVYFRVPADMTSFRLWLGATPPGETAVGTLLSPSGRQMAQFDCSAVSVDEKTIVVPAGEHGWWKLLIEKAPTGVMDDVYVHLDAPHAGYVCLDPAAALGVEAAPEQ